MGPASWVPCPVPGPLDGPPALESGCPCLSWAGSHGGCSEDQDLLPPDLDFVPTSIHSRLPGVESLPCSARRSPYLLDPFSFPPPRSLPQVPQPRGFCVLPMPSGGMCLVCSCIDIPTAAHMHEYNLCFYLIFKSLVS